MPLDPLLAALHRQEKGEQIRRRPFLQGTQLESTWLGEQKEVWISALIPSCREQSRREVLHAFQTPGKRQGRGQGSASLFFKGPDRISKLAFQCLSSVVTTAQPCWHSRKAAPDNTEMNGAGCLPIKLYLWAPE